MRQISIGGVPEHKRQEGDELAAQVAAFLGQTTAQPVEELAEQAPESAPLPVESAPHMPPQGDTDSIVIELRAIRAEAQARLARLNRKAQEYFDKPLIQKFSAAA